MYGIYGDEKNTAAAGRREKLFLRQRITDAIRSWFRAEGFLEAEVPLLVSGTTPDPFIQSFSCDGKYLTTSTEYQIKRMAAAGFEKVYTLTKNFRQGESDRTHNPEFTMLEWARSSTAASCEVPVSMEVIEADAIAVIRSVCNELFPGKDTIEYQGHRISLAPESWERVTFQQLLSDTYGIAIPEAFDPSELISLAEQAGLQGLTADPFFRDNPGFLLSDLLDRAIKKLGFRNPALIQKWPVSMTSSADCGNLESFWVTRTEIIIGGLEIADGFPFLRDYGMQKQFFANALTARSGEELPPVELDEKYLEALRTGLPPGAGMALGVDRLCMLLTDSLDIRDVLCFAWDEL